MNHRALSIFVAGVALLATGAASAHTGVEHAGGLLHPFSGWDHLLAAVAVGLLAARHGGRKVLVLPLIFLAVMLLGMALALTGMALTGMSLAGVEAGLMLSLVVLGGIAAFGMQLPLSAAAVVLALFALGHGYAHGNELPAAAGVWSYGAGVLLGSALLHAAGVVLGRSAHRLLVRGAGAVIGASGLVMLAGV